MPAGDNLGPLFRRSASTDLPRLAAREIVAGGNRPGCGVGALRRPRNYLNVDLAMLWDGWIVLLENKVAAASVTRNQLATYYEIARKQLASGSFLGVEAPAHARICMIYLTPTATTGAVEFDSLNLLIERLDVKIHLSWTDVLEDLKQAFPESDCDTFGQIVVDGRKLTERILRTRPMPKTISTPERIAVKRLLESIKTRIALLMAEEPSFKMKNWSAPSTDELYASIGERHANVYLNVSPIDTNAIDSENIRLRASVSFRIAGKAPQAKRSLFAEFRVDHWEKTLEMPAGALTLDMRGFLVHDVQREGAIEPMSAEVAALFCRFLSVFRPFF